MNVETIIEQIDAQISKLLQARELLQSSVTPDIRRGPGRPKGTNNGAAKAVAVIPAKRVLSAGAKARIAEAQRLRWAESRKAAKAAKTISTKSA